MKYQFAVDKIDTDTTHGKVLAQIRPGSTVLECGCATGYITRFLKEQLNCKMHIIEYVQEAFDAAKEFAESGVCGDLMEDSWCDSFRGIEYDYILFMDVLEHLPCPEKVLAQAVSLLKDDGTVIITLPNIAHNDVLINLYYNEFNYQERGLLDNTHIKFFGANNLKKFISDAGLGMVRLDHTYVKTGRSEQFWEKDCKASAELIEVLGARQGGDVYQFVITAKKREFIQKHNLDLVAENSTSAEYRETIGIQDIYNSYVNSQQQLEACNQYAANLEASVQEADQRFVQCSAALQEADRRYENCDIALQQSQKNLQTFMDNYLDTAKSLAETNVKLQTTEQKLQEANRRCNALTEQYEQSMKNLQKQNQELQMKVESVCMELKNAETMVCRLRDNYTSVEQLHNQIIHSRGYRLLNLYYRIRVALIPNGSIRYKIVKAIVKPFLTLYRKLRGIKQRNSKVPEIPTMAQSVAFASSQASVVNGSAEVSVEAPINNFLNIDQSFEMMRDCKRIDIISVEHTAYIARLLQGILWDAGLECNLHLNEPDHFENIPYIMICPQNFKRFPALYIAYQMEQTINSRWLTEEYLTILQNAYAVFDYSLENIKYFSKDPTLAGKLYYVPVDVCDEMLKGNEPCEKEYDVLFYGSPYIDRRQEFLKPIAEKFDLHIICDKFGPALYEEMRKAKLVINVHYYQNALLETTRLYETLSASDCLIISERSGDATEEIRLEELIDFTEVGNVEAMMEHISFWLSHEDERKKAAKKNYEVLRTRPNATKFYLYRFLLANDRVTFDQFYNAVGKYIHFDGGRVCLSLPESITRRNAFISDNKYGFEFFPGLKHRAGWIGCGMSYKFMFKKAKEQNLEQLLICEDDVYFPADFEERFQHILDYIEKHDDWSVFSGIMADLGRVKPLQYVEEQGEEFIYLDKMISMVFNIYDKSVFDLIASWDNMNRNVNSNTVDRYLEDKKLRVLTTCPFLVGHKEDLSSTIWGAQNTIYTELIENSSIKLRGIVDDFKKKM